MESSSSELVVTAATALQGSHLYNEICIPIELLDSPLIHHHLFDTDDYGDPALVLFVSADDVTMFPNLPLQLSPGGLKIFCQIDTRSTLIPNEFIERWKDCQAKLLFAEWPANMSSSALRTAVEGHANSLLAIDDGIVGVTAGFKQRRGLVNYDQPCIQVLVEKKVRKPAHMIPSKVDGWPVDVVINQYRPLVRTRRYVKFSWEERWNGVTLMKPTFPLRIGDRVRVGDATGTLCCFVRSNDPRDQSLLGLTVAHIFHDTETREWSTECYADETYSKSSKSLIGKLREQMFDPSRKLSDVMCVFGCDYAAFSIDNGWHPTTGQKIGEPFDLVHVQHPCATGSVGPFQLSLIDTCSGDYSISNPHILEGPKQVFKMGAETRMTAGRVQEIQLFTCYKKGTLRRRYIVHGMDAMEGDSGSIVFDASGKAFGMLVWARQDTRTCIVIPIAEILLTLNIRLD